MNNIDNQYLALAKRVLNEGKQKKDRTGVGTISISGAMLEHDMKEGAPVITTKKVAYKTCLVELEGFLKGISDKKWYQNRGCNIWNEWARRDSTPYAIDAETKVRMIEERDLGPIYGFQWRHFGAQYDDCYTDYTGKGIDQVVNIIDTARKKPEDRRLIVMAWNPKDNPAMAIPPCHFGWQVLINENILDLIWWQRSCDLLLGVPFNIASYGTLLHLLAKELKCKEGKLIGFLSDVHIYNNHLEQVKEQLSREPRKLSKIITEPFTSIFSWEHQHTRLEGYNPHPPIKALVAV